MPYGHTKIGTIGNEDQPTTTATRARTDQTLQDHPVISRPSQGFLFEKIGRGTRKSQG